LVNGVEDGDVVDLDSDFGLMVLQEFLDDDELLDDSLMRNLVRLQIELVEQVVPGNVAGDRSPPLAPVSGGLAKTSDKEYPDQEEAQAWKSADSLRWFPRKPSLTLVYDSSGARNCAVVRLHAAKVRLQAGSTMDRQSSLRSLRLLAQVTGGV